MIDSSIMLPIVAIHFCVCSFCIWLGCLPVVSSWFYAQSGGSSTMYRTSSASRQGTSFSHVSYHVMFLLYPKECFWKLYQEVWIYLIILMMSYMHLQECTALHNSTCVGLLIKRLLPRVLGACIESCFSPVVLAWFHAHSGRGVAIYGCFWQLCIHVTWQLAGELATGSRDTQ